MQKKLKSAKATNNHHHKGGIGRVPVVIPPDAKDVPEFDDEAEMKFIADPRNPYVRQLAQLLGWDRVRALDES